MTSLTLVRRIAARPVIVFDALTTPEGIAAWWGPDDFPARVAQADARPGGCFRVRFRTLDGEEHECSGEYLEVARPERLVMSWRWTVGGEPEEFGRDSRIEIALRPIEEGTELTFTHAGLRSAASRSSHAHGWTHSLAKLARHLSGGRPASSSGDLAVPGAQPGRR
jgi:uncharacterized protein YndB with AHSA1/START domain